MTSEQETLTLNQQSPLEYLLQLEERVRMNRANLPARQEEEVKWNGVCCELLGIKTTIALDDVAEVIEVDSLTDIPGCCHWVMGVLNKRGRLLPVFSISAFLTGPSVSHPEPPDRVIALDRGGVFCGLSVDVLYGMQKFSRQDFGTFEDEDLKQGTAELLVPFLKGVFRQDEESWYELDVMALAERIQTTDPSLAGQQSH